MTASDNGAGRPIGALVRLVIPLIILAGGYGAYQKLSVQTDEAKRPEAKQRVIRTRVVELGVSEYPVQITTQGIVRSHNEITLSAQVSGQITSLSPNFEVGAFFSEGEVLIELDQRDYQTTLKLAQADRQSVESALKLAKLEHERTRAGFKGAGLSVVTEAEVDQTAAALTRAEANLDSATAAVEQAELDLERTRIRAPFDGRVRAKMVGLGQSLNPGMASAVIFAVDYAEVRLPVSARDRLFLKLPESEGAAPIPVELRDAIDENSGLSWSGSIVRTEGALDEGSLELVAVARIDDPFGLVSGNAPLRIGQPVSGTIYGEMLTDVIAMPRVAVRELDQIILISKSDNRLTKATVKPIWSDEDVILVRNSPEYDGMLLATTHIVYAPEGSPVEIIPELDDTIDPTPSSKESKT